MYNSDLPTRAELPTTAQLVKSTILALIAAIAILVTVVLPAEYAIDPTGIGRVLKLTEMGEIKAQLAAEAEADRHQDSGGAKPAPGASLLQKIGQALTIGGAQAGERLRLAQAAREDETVIMLNPAEGVEYKIPLNKGAEVRYSWKVEGGVVNYDMHGTPGSGKETSYKAARGVAGDEGVLTARFDGTHGWFFRNRGSAPVTIRLKTNGAYTEIKKVS